MKTYTFLHLVSVDAEQGTEKKFECADNKDAIELAKDLLFNRPCEYEAIRIYLGNEYIDEVSYEDVE